MSSGARAPFLAIACGALVGGALALVCGGPAAIDTDPPAHGSREAALRSVAKDLAAAEQRRAARRLREHARAERPHAEPAPRRRVGALGRRRRADAIAVARRFHRAFARLELRRGGTSEIRATATRDFAETLLGEPPRVLLAPKPARGLSRLEVTRADGRPVGAVELVGRQRRGRRWEPMAIDLVLVRGSWRVVGLGL